MERGCGVQPVRLNHRQMEEEESAGGLSQRRNAQAGGASGVWARKSPEGFRSPGSVVRFRRAGWACAVRPYWAGLPVSSFSGAGGVEPGMPRFMYWVLEPGSRTRLGFWPSGPAPDTSSTWAPRPMTLMMFSPL